MTKAGHIAFGLTSLDRWTAACRLRVQCAEGQLEGWKRPFIQHSLTDGFGREAEYLSAKYFWKWAYFPSKVETKLILLTEEHPGNYSVFARVVHCIRVGLRRHHALDDFRAGRIGGG